MIIDCKPQWMMSRERSVVDVSEVVPKLRCCCSAVTTEVQALRVQARGPATATTFHRFKNGRELTIWLIQHEWDILNHARRVHDLLNLRIRSRMRAREGMVVTKHAGQLGSRSAGTSATITVLEGMHLA